MGETSLLWDALKQQSFEKGNELLNKIKRKLERLGMGDICKNEEKRTRNVWREISEKCVEMEEQNMEGGEIKRKI